MVPLLGLALREVALIISNKIARTQAALAVIDGAVRTIASLRVEVKGVKECSAWLTDVQRRQIPYVTTLALTRTAKQVQRKLEAEIVRVFDQPTAFTKRAIGIRPATKATLSSTIFVKPAQAEYLYPQIMGGSRKPKPHEQRFTEEADAPGRYWIAGEGIKLNSAGNLTKTQVLKLATRLKKKGRDVFAGVPKNQPTLPFGIYERVNFPGSKGRRGAASIRPLLVQIQAPRYLKRFDFYGIAMREAEKIFPIEFERAWREVIG